jgi:putative transposase
MTSKTCADLGVDKSFSRPRVSNDNPFSESQFKTMKYQPNRLMTPHDVHHGLAQEKWQQRARALAAAYAAHPERFPHDLPMPPPMPTEVWINQPSDHTITSSAAAAIAH